MMERRRPPGDWPGVSRREPVRAVRPRSVCYQICELTQAQYGPLDAGMGVEALTRAMLDGAH